MLTCTIIYVGDCPGSINVSLLRPLCHVTRHDQAGATPPLRGQSDLASEAPQRWSNGDLADDNRAEAGQLVDIDGFLFGF